MQLSEKAQATRERILLAADDLFFLHGYHATGLEKVIKAAGVTKGNFYYYFKSKEELAVQTLEWHFKQTILQTEQAVKVANENKHSPLNSLFTILELMSAKQKLQQQAGQIRGCYFGNLSLELSAESKAVKNKLKLIFDQFIKSFTSLLEAARSAGEISQSIEPSMTAAMILSQMEGAILLDKANQKNHNVDNSIEFIRKFLVQENSLS